MARSFFKRNIQYNWRQFKKKNGQNARILSHKWTFLIKGSGYWLLQKLQSRTKKYDRKCQRFQLGKDMNDTGRNTSISLLTYRLTQLFMGISLAVISRWRHSLASFYMALPQYMHVWFIRCIIQIAVCFGLFWTSHAHETLFMNHGFSPVQRKIVLTLQICLATLHLNLWYRL